MSTPITDNKGKKYWFNSEKLKKELKAYEKSYTKAHLREQIIERSNYPFDTVKDWLRGKHRPRDINAVYVIEELLNLKKGDLLLDHNPEEDNMSNTNTNNISAEERTAAAKLYSIMYDMILAFDNNFPDQEDPYAEYFIYNMEWTEQAKYSFAHQEELRYKCLVDIRKNAIWFPSKMRDALEDLVNKEFGPADYDYNDMAYGSDEYKNYLKKNKLKDNYEARDLYATAFRRELFKELDEIFDKYLIK